TLGYAPDGLRHAVDLGLTLNAFSPIDSSGQGTSAKLLIDTGARVVADPLANITLTSNNVASVFGEVDAPGGTVSVNAPYAWIGAHAIRDVAGTFVPNPKVTTYATGNVLPGGSIALTGANIVALDGSVFDISGARATVQVPAGYGRTSTQQIWSDGG